MPVGQCNICGWEGEFGRPEHGREGTICGNCVSTGRLRAVMYWFGRLEGRENEPVHAWPAAKQKAILESSPRGPYAMMLAEKYDYYETEFDPARIAAGDQPRKFADFQKLHYPDGTFDVVIASDVFEHVRDDAAGYSEIYRTLKPGGTLILTVPYSHHIPSTVKRVDTSGPDDVLLMEAEYHGGGGHTLTYRNYGRDLLTLLRTTGFSVLHARTDVPALGIPAQDVMIAQKSDFIDLPERRETAGTMRPLGPLLPHRLFLLLKFNMQGLLRFLKQGR